MSVKVATRKEMGEVARDLVRPELESVQSELRNLNRRLDAALEEAEKTKQMVETEVIRRRAIDNRLDARLSEVLRMIAVVENSRNGK